jgi:signal transduction histidine kinase
MLEPRLPRLPVQPPTVTPPRPFVERRVAFRRAADQRLHEERAFLARSLDCLAADAPALDRLARLLRLLAKTAGAKRVAILADGIERSSAVSIAPGEDHAAAEALAAWLDTAAKRSRAERAAAPPTPVAFIEDGNPARTSARPAAAGCYALLPVPGSGSVFLGFEFPSSARAEKLTDRLPDEFVRHAAVALAVVTRELAAEREAATLHARDVERSRFVSVVAHELRTPLTGLRGYLDLILDGRVDDPAIEREFLTRSRSITSSMSELVGDLLELSRLESGTLDLEMGPFSVAETAGHVAAGLLPIAIERDIRLTTDLPPRLRTATGDRRRVEQILTNLAGNALKFTPAGGTVDVIGRFDGPVAVFVVRDDGAGIVPADRERIFERFQRLESHEAIAGTGLGLPIARDLAREMHGDLDVASVPGSGSAFVLVLPGPAPVSASAVHETLRIALAGEELELEERAVLRALGAASGKRRDGPAGGPRGPGRPRGERARQAHPAAVVDG